MELLGFHNGAVGVSLWSCWVFIMEFLVFIVELLGFHSGAVGFS